MKKEISALKPKRLSVGLSDRVVTELGGTNALASLCGVRPSSVSDWKRTGVPRPWVLYLRERFKTLPVMREQEISTF